MFDLEAYLRKDVLMAIANGYGDLKSINFYINIFEEFEEVSDELLTKVINRLLDEGLINNRDSKLYLKSKGLLTTSEFASEFMGYRDYDKEEVVFESNTDKKSFYYENNLNKDVIFSPNYGFYVGLRNEIAENTFKIYKTEIIKKDFVDMDVLLSLENFLSYSESSYSEGGSWIIKNSKSSLCGFRLINLKNALEQINSSDVNAKIVFSSHNYFVICDIKFNRISIDELKLRFYISNYPETPYLDVIQNLEKKLKLFLKFIGEKNIPRGKEIEIDMLEFTTTDEFIGKIRFKPQILGVYSEIDRHMGLLPFLIVITPSIFKPLSHIGQLATWFAASDDVYFDNDFKDRSYHLGRIKNYVIEDTIIFSLTLVNVPRYTEGS